MIDFGCSDRPLTSPCGRRMSSSRNFRSLPRKDFCNNIGMQRRLLVRRALALLDQPEHGERIAIVLGREISDREGLRRPRHQLLDKSQLTEGGPVGDIVTARPLVVFLIVTFPSAVGVVEADKIRPVGLHLRCKLHSTRGQRRRLHCRARRRRRSIGGGISRALQGLGIETGTTTPKRALLHRRSRSAAGTRSARSDRRTHRHGPGQTSPAVGWS